MTLGFLRKMLPSWQNSLLAIFAAVLLILAFPDFEFWFLAWFALVPLMWAIERETTLQKPARSKGIIQAVESPVARSFVLGWIFGTIFFFGTCWWLTYAPIHYAGFPPVLAYLLLFCVTAITGLFPAIFAAILSVLLRRFGSGAFLASPFVWVFSEFLRYWVTGNDWNAIAYSQAFASLPSGVISSMAKFGGVALSSFLTVAMGTFFGLIIIPLRYQRIELLKYRFLHTALLVFVPPLVILAACIFFLMISIVQISSEPRSEVAKAVGIQPNVPMDGLDQTRWRQLRQRQIDLAETEIKKLPTANRQLPTVVILPESPMNFMYSDDREFQQFIGDFARRNNVSVLFNSSEPDGATGKYFNSAVMVGPDGKLAAQYDKLYLLPFGEAVPSFLEGIVPGFVGNFAYGREYDLLPVGDAKPGVMICFESHFGALSREYVRNGADVIIEMTNDGYLGPTPVLRQHLANAVFRAVETNRPVLRVTNVGITAYINERGEVLDAAPSYQEDTRVWSVSKSDGTETFYVRYGDWFAWLCSFVTIGLLGYAIFRRRQY